MINEIEQGDKITVTESQVVKEEDNNVSDEHCTNDDGKGNEIEENEPILKNIQAIGQNLVCSFRGFLNKRK